jgi:hypothetical protein
MNFQIGKLYIPKSYIGYQGMIYYGILYCDELLNTPQYRLDLRPGVILTYICQDEKFSEGFGGFPKLFLYNCQIYKDSYGTYSKPEQCLEELNEI